MRIVPSGTLLIILGLLFLSCEISAQTGKEQKVIKNGSLVSLEYTLADDKGKVIESNKGKDPLRYTHGQGELIPGLEKELEGMKAGAQKNIRVKPEDAYGTVDPQAFREIPKANIPPDALKVGTRLLATTPQGQSIPVLVHEIKDKTVILDFNHPLAGKTLSFDVTVLDVKAPEAK